jgi:hypothetical protein
VGRRIPQGCGGMPARHPANEKLQSHPPRVPRGSPGGLEAGGGPLRDSGESIGAFFRAPRYHPSSPSIPATPQGFPESNRAGGASCVASGWWKEPSVEAVRWRPLPRHHSDSSLRQLIWKAPPNQGITTVEGASTVHPSVEALLTCPPICSDDDDTGASTGLYQRPRSMP